MAVGLRSPAYLPRAGGSLAGSRGWSGFCSLGEQNPCHRGLQPWNSSSCGSVFNEIWLTMSPQTVPRARRPRSKPSSTGTPPPAPTPGPGRSPRPGPGRAPRLRPRSRGRPPSPYLPSWFPSRPSSPHRRRRRPSGAGSCGSSGTRRAAARVSRPCSRVCGLARPPKRSRTSFGR